MPAKLQYEAFVGILIIHNFGFFWQLVINLSVLWGRGYSVVLLAVLAFEFYISQSFLLDEIN
jgi:hypothetical protein